VSRTIAPATLKAWLKDGAELALLDVREEGAHSESHPFYAASLPLSRLELMVEDMVPRKSARIAVIDDGGDLGARAARKLESLGYSDVSVVEGGSPGWGAAGYELFSGVHVPSKAFGEAVEHHFGTPHVEASELKRWMDEGRRLVVLDSRPMDEFQVMSIPGATCVPGAELSLRLPDLAGDPEALVVVNCAGRTRSIMGAQSLINAGAPNKVVALKNGTMGWHLSGLELDRGKARRYAPLSPRASAAGTEAAAKAAERFGVRRIDEAELARWRADAGRTLYLLDVRAEEEYEAGHLPGSQHAPGGQLVQETETWCAVLGARIVLLDDEPALRAVMTASWLQQMGWNEVRVMALPSAGLERGPRRPRPSIARAAANEIAPAELAAALKSGEAQALDFALSRDYAKGHVPGAWFAIRARLAEALPKLPRASFLAFTSPDGVIARLAAPEASELTATPIRVLAGGTAAWREAGLPLEDGFARALSERDDVWRRPYEHDGDVETHMRAYLTWEVDLVAQLARDGDARFRLAPPQ
jgi:rhodanese-related sulfurtransferase